MLGAKARTAFAVAGVMTCVPAQGADGGAADAGGYSIDIEFLRPTFGQDAFTGVDVPRVERSLTMRAGTVLQVQQSPLTLYESVTGEELGAVVANRFSAMVGASLDIERFTVGIVAPLSVNAGTQQPAYAADGMGFGDVALNTRLTVLRTRRDALNVGVRGGIMLPTGRTRSYMGEEGLRGSFGALVAARLGPLTLATDAGLLLRDPVSTGASLDVESELTWGNAVRLNLPAATRLAFNGQVLARANAQQPLQGVGETSLEGLLGIEAYPSSTTALGLSLGRGLTAGYGTTDFRMVGHLVVQLQKAEPIHHIPDWFPPSPPEGGERDPWEPPPDLDADIVTETPTTIELRDRLQFYVDTAVLKPESEPTLDAIASLLNRTPAIGLVLIEGPRLAGGRPRGELRARGRPGRADLAAPPRAWCGLRAARLPQPRRGRPARAVRRPQRRVRGEPARRVPDRAALRGRPVPHLPPRAAPSVER